MEKKIIMENLITETIRLREQKTVLLAACENALDSLYSLMDKDPTIVRLKESSAIKELQSAIEQAGESGE